MNRLTKKVLDNYESIANSDTIKDKLGRLEDIEEQLGCQLEVAFKALMNGIYTKESIFDNELDLFEVRGIEKKGVSVISQFCGYADCDFTCEYKDYKKTWWLRKDKSE